MNENIQKNQNNQSNKAIAQTKKRTFTETEQSVGSYNVGIKKKSRVSKQLIEKVNNHIRLFQKSFVLELVHFQCFCDVCDSKNLLRYS